MMIDGARGASGGPGATNQRAMISSRKSSRLQAGHSLELGEYKPHLGQSLASPYPGQQGGNGFFNRLFPAVVKLNQEATNNQVNLPEDYSKIGGNGSRKPPELPKPFNP